MNNKQLVDRMLCQIDLIPTKQILIECIDYAPLWYLYHNLPDIKTLFKIIILWGLKFQIKKEKKNKSKWNTSINKNDIPRNITLLPRD